MIFSFAKKNKILVRKFINQEDKSDIALLCFNGKIKDEIIKLFNQRFLSNGVHIKNGGKCSPRVMHTLLGAGIGSLGMASALSGQLFMATANTSTLMAIGNGLGSAVMEAGKIVSQAPFVPVAGGLIPVVAPLLVFQAISTITLLNEFDIINKKLDCIQNTMNRIIQRSEATIIGEIISAHKRISDIEEKFAISHQFTKDMIISLALLEDKVNPIFERFDYLYNNQKITKDSEIVDLKFKQADAFMAVISSILDIRIELLKIKLNIQENPEFIKRSAVKFKDKIDYYNNLWDRIKNDPENIKEIENDINETINNMNWWKKRMPAWLGGKSEEYKDLQKKSIELKNESSQFQEKISNIFEKTERFDTAIKQSFDNQAKMNIVYWKDKNNEYCYYTDDLLVQGDEK